MLFPTVEFAVYFPIVLAISWALMPHLQWWKIFIVVASYVFYGTANWKFCFLLAGVTLGNHLFARLIASTQNQRRKKQFLAAGVGLDLAVLGAFKYYAFFVEDVDRVFDSTGLGLPLPLLTIALPVGISFFTFQAITYVVDTYRGHAKPARLLDVAVYLSFFSHLVAGPIVRASEFLPQIEKPRDPNNVAVGAGLFLIAVGLIKKVAIADFLAREVVDPVFAVPQAFSAPDVIFGAYAYAAQIYCDFSGYTDMAIGLALLLGIVFPQNFNRPYRSRSIREFWRRWHITLSRWLRDYLYIPLGGNRMGFARQLVNLLVTMTLGGLWHGANWTFMLWGAGHGLGIAFVHGVRRVAALRWAARMPRWLAVLLTFHFVAALWILFRAPDVATAARVAAGPFVAPGAELGAFVTQNGFVLGLLAFFAATHRWDSHEVLGRVVKGVPKAALVPALVFAWLMAIVVSHGSSAKFIYFDF